MQKLMLRNLDLKVKENDMYGIVSPYWLVDFHS
jgi:hypothetical protein